MVKKQMFLVMCLCLISVLASVGQAQLPEPVGWWRLDDGDGTTASDTSGNGYDGTVSGGATWVDGMHYKALELDGTGYVDLPPAVWNENLTDNTFSFCMWTRIYEIPGGGNTVVGLGPGRDFQSHLPWSSGTIYFDMTGTGGGNRGTTPYDPAWLGEWSHWT